jgi:hypothetical protein
MTLLDKLQAHKGGLLQLKTQLYWYGRGGWDNNPGRICLLLDTAATATTPAARAAARAATAAAGRASLTTRRHVAPAGAALLLIDSQPHWVWIAEEDVDLLVNDPPAN